jgi:DNA-binding NarL/FixJ family response regulator
MCAKPSPSNNATLSNPPIPHTPSSPEDRLKILLVEDHQLVRQGMKALLSQKSRFEVCGEAESAPEALELVAKLSPHLAIVDITLKSTNGIELTKDIRVLSPATQVLVVSAHGENVYAERALRAGAMGYLMKDEPAENIIIAIETIMRGEVFVSERIKGRMLHRFVHKPSDALVSPIDRLSDREMEVLRLIGNGYGTRDIAGMLNLSVKTIDSYREHLKEKLSFATGGDLVRYAIQWTKSETV